MTITDQITALLAADPICGGRVTGETVRAIAALVAGWQPIETAPRDGMLFLATGWDFGRVGTKRHTAIAYWSDQDGFVELGDYEGGLYYLDHWVPLPPPPIERGDFGAGEVKP